MREYVKTRVEELVNTLIKCNNEKVMVENGVIYLESKAVAEPKFEYNPISEAFSFLVYHDEGMVQIVYNKGAMSCYDLNEETTGYINEFEFLNYISQSIKQASEFSYL